MCIRDRCVLLPILSFSASPGRWSHILIPFYQLLSQQSQWMFMVSLCLPRHKFPTVIQLTTNKYIILIIWFYIFFFQGILWCFSYPVESIWEDLISLTTFIYRHKLTWQVDVQKCKKITCNCMAKTDHSGQRKGKK